MPVGRAALIFGLGVLAGGCTVYLMIRPKAGRLAEALPVIAVSVAAVLWAGSMGVSMLVPLGVALLGTALGWVVASHGLLRAHERPVPRVSRTPAGAAHQTAIIYFTHGEPEAYEPGPWLEMLHELASTVDRFPPKLIWPFVLDGIKQSFAVVSESPHNRIHAETLEAVSRTVGRPDVAWYLAFLDSEPHLYEVVADAVARGATDIVFLPVFVTESDHTAVVDALPERMGLGEAGVRSVRTSVLWDEERLVRLVGEKVKAAAGERDRSRVGVMLVGHGQPREWDLTHPTETEQEQRFRDDIRALLLREGFAAELVSDAWMSFREPRVPARVRELVSAGATAVCGVPVSISADSLHSLHDTPRLVRKGARGSRVEIIDVGGWNTDPLLVEALADRVVDALTRLGSGAA